MIFGLEIKGEIMAYPNSGVIKNMGLEKKKKKKHPVDFDELPIEMPLRSRISRISQPGLMTPGSIWNRIHVVPQIPQNGSGDQDACYLKIW